MLVQVSQIGALIIKSSMFIVEEVDFNLFEIDQTLVEWLVPCKEYYISGASTPMRAFGLICIIGTSEVEDQKIQNLGIPKGPDGIFTVWEAMLPKLQGIQYRRCSRSSTRTPSPRVFMTPEARELISSYPLEGSGAEGYSNGDYIAYLKENLEHSFCFEGESIDWGHYVCVPNASEYFEPYLYSGSWEQGFWGRKPPWNLGSQSYCLVGASCDLK